MIIIRTLKFLPITTMLRLNYALCDKMKRVEGEF